MKGKLDIFKENFYKLETAFKIIYIVHLILAFNALVNRTFFIQVTSALTLICGAIVMLTKLITFPQYLRRKNFILLNLFLLSYILSSLVNYEFGIWDNFKGFIWLLLQIWILYFINKDTDIKKECFLISVVYIIVVSLQNLISLVMFFFGVSYRSHLSDGSIHMFGFFWGRLWGVYDDPNHGAVISAIAVLLAVWLLSMSKRKMLKAFLTLSFIIQTAFIILSDSRTGFLCLLFGSVLLWMIKSFYSYSKLDWKKVIKTILMSIMTIVVILALRGPVQNGFGVVRNVTDRMLSQDTEQEVETEVGREGNSADLSNSDPSNRRFDIWKSSVEIFLDSPLVGAGGGTINSYAHKYLSDTYIVNNDLTEFRAMHNVFFDVLAGQGLVGICILIGIIINTVVFIFKRFQYIQKSERFFLSTLFSILVMLAMASLLISFIIYVNSPQSFIFWMTFGYFVSILKRTEEIK